MDTITIWQLAVYFSGVVVALILEFVMEKTFLKGKKGTADNLSNELLFPFLSWGAVLILSVVMICCRVHPAFRKGKFITYFDSIDSTAILEKLYNNGKFPSE